MTHWWRAYDDSIDHPKLLKLSDAMHRAWWTLMCIASANGGVLPPAADIAVRLRMKPSKVALWLAELVNAKLIDNQDGIFRPHNWDDRQFQSDTSTSRVAKYREKRRAAGLPQMGDYSVFRPALIQRDGERCVYCEKTTGLVVDHMTPITLGGTDHPDNLALACKPCNSGKAGRTPEMAGMAVIVTSAEIALKRYRDSKSNVTVTVTSPEQSRAETESEQSRAEPPRTLDEIGLKNEAVLVASFTALCSSLNRKPPDMRQIATWLLDGVPLGTIQAAVTPILKRKADMASLAYCDSAVREAHGRAAAPQLQVVSSRVWVDEGTPEWACWQREYRGGRGSPVTDHQDADGHRTGRRGWYFESKVPAGYDDVTCEKLPPRSEDAA